MTTRNFIIFFLTPRLVWISLSDACAPSNLTTSYARADIRGTIALRPEDDYRNLRDRQRKGMDAVRMRRR